MIQDDEIIHLLFERNEQSIQLLREKYEKLAFYIVGNILTDQRDREECVEDTWLHLWDTIPPKQPDNLSGYLSAVARNLALDRFRYNNAGKRSSALSEAYEELKDSIPEQRANFDAAIIDDMIFNQVINQFLSELEKTARIIFVKRYWYGEKTARIAKEMKLSDVNVRTSLFRTRKKLKGYLEKEGIYL